ncbi:MAG: two-component sensor histidine kinase [Bacteroidetes bacterium GWE2_29_8]|nr:MAG: two-component sensor histidine kinase [Bacteroidetes bacterium GWE2_29_8]OFY13773.1 MAG: two-component sensor histidine kinase [Bacteroidetes bacterium GWF2_29_10]
MKNISLEKIAFYTSLILSLSLCLLLFLESLIFQNISLIGILIIFTISFLLSFFLFLNAIRLFIYDKIKVIYKTIHNLKPNQSNSQSNKINLSGDILKNANDEVLGWAKERREEIDKLKTMANYRKEFLGNVSHELKTPIFNIQGYILTLLDGGLEDSTINKQYLMKAERSIERLIAIVEDLEEISKLESQNFKLSISRFDIIDLTQDVIEFLEIKANNRNIELLIDKNFASYIFVEADKEKIRQVLINLIENSIKYGNEQGYTKIRFFDMHDNILVEIKDNGLGIEEKHIPRIFERFYRAEKSRSREQGGSGLGLAIVKHIIEAHYQVINVKSLVNEGTTFTFTLKKATK